MDKSVKKSINDTVSRDAHFFLLKRRESVTRRYWYDASSPVMFTPSKDKNMPYTYLTHRKTKNNVSDELTVRYLKKRLRTLNRLIKTTDASHADYSNRDRVAFQLRDAMAAQRSSKLGLNALTA